LPMGRKLNPLIQKSRLICGRRNLFIRANPGKYLVDPDD